MIIDAHVHLPVGEKCNSLQMKKEKLLMEMKRNQVSKCIVISDSCLESEIGTMDECVELFKDTDNVYVVGGISPMIEFERLSLKLKKYLENKLVVGIKLFTGHEAFYLTDKRLNEVYKLAIRYNVPVLFHSGWDNAQYSDAKLVAEVARKYPELKLVCCHCFYPVIEKFQLLVEYPNVYFDISSVADDVANLSEIATKIRELIAKVPTRVLFGSDYSCCSQREHIEFVENLELSEEVKMSIFEKNILQVYSLEL